MAPRPEDRYASPRALADDVERWLADEPVSAYREPWTGRVARWARRHQARVASAVAAVAVAAICLGAAAVLLAAANERERKLADLARREGEAARANFRMAFDAVDRSFTQVSESQLVNVPGLQPGRQLLDTSRDFFQKFLDQRRHDPSVQAELARTYLRLADIAFAT